MAPAYKTSRWPAMTRVRYPLIPGQPSGYTLSGNQYTFALPPDNRDVFGILIQTHRTKTFGSKHIVLSSDGPDTRSMKIVGQDTKGQYLEEVIQLNGTTPVTSVKVYTWILWVDSYFGTVLNEIPTPLPNGGTTAFTVAKNVIPNSETVYLNGNPLVRNTPLVTGDYNMVGNTINFLLATPGTGNQILVSYVYALVVNRTVTISSGGTTHGQLLPGALQWLADPIVYRYEDVSLSLPKPNPGTLNSLGSPILAPVLTDPGLTFTAINLCIPPNGEYVGPAAGTIIPGFGTSPVETSEFLGGVFKAIHGYVCPDKLYVYFYNLLDEMCAPYIVQIRGNLGTVINVKDFGAVGDGVTDDTTAIQCALDQAHKNWQAQQDLFAGLGSPAQTGSTTVLIPSGFNCLVGHFNPESAVWNYIYSYTPTTFTFNQQNIPNYALLIQSGVTFQIDGQLSLGKAGWASQAICGFSLTDVSIIGQGVIDVNGRVDGNTVVANFLNVDYSAIVRLDGANIRVEGITFRNTGWLVNPQLATDTAQFGSPQHLGYGALRISLRISNRQSSVRNVTFDGGPAYADPSEPGVATGQFLGFLVGLKFGLVVEHEVAIPSPLTRPTPGNPSVKCYYTSVDVTAGKGLIVEKNAFLNCAFGILGECDNWVMQNNTMVNLECGIFIGGGKNITVKGNDMRQDVAVNSHTRCGIFFAGSSTVPGSVDTTFRDAGNAISSGQMMGLRIFENHISGISGTGIKMTFTAGAFGQAGDYSGHLFMSDVEIFGNSSNNNRFGFRFNNLHSTAASPFQNINIHDNTARGNLGNIVGKPITEVLTSLNSADFPTWEDSGVFDVARDIPGSGAGISRNNFGEYPYNANGQPFGMSWNNPAIRNEVIINGTVFRHWDFADIENPAGAVNSTNRQFTTAHNPAVAHPYAAPTISQFTFNQENMFLFDYHDDIMAVQDAPAGVGGNALADFPAPKLMHRYLYIPQDVSGFFGNQLNYLVRKNTVTFNNTDPAFAWSSLINPNLKVSYRFLVDENPAHTIIWQSGFDN